MHLRDFTLFGIATIVLGISTNATAADPPNIVLIMADDLGFSDLGCYGGEIDTPNLNALAANGLRYTEFRNTSRCCPSRASLMTGKFQHAVDMGWMTAVDEHRIGYRGQLSDDHPTVAELLNTGGYQTRMSGKWHLTVDTNFQGDPTEPPNGSWPTQRGFEEYYGGLSGGGGYYRPESLARNLQRIPKESLPDDYYYTHAITENAVQFVQRSDPDRPLFLYVAYYAPHRPLEAPAERVARCRARYQVGYDVLRAERFERQKKLGIFPADAAQGKPGQELPNDSPAWTELTDKQRSEWVTEMATYAAMVEIMDDGIGEIVAALKERGQFKNTLILFLSDNGATYEGGLISQLAADLSNSPYRNYKQFTHLGGVSSPLIIHWPAQISGDDAGVLLRDACHINDLLPTCLAAAELNYPPEFHGKAVSSPDGSSLLATFTGEAMPQRTFYWEHQSSRAIQQGGWRLVSLRESSPWELYNLANDPFEQDDLSKTEPDRVNELSTQWQEWAKSNKVLPLETLPWTKRINHYKSLHAGE